MLARCYDEGRRWRGLEDTHASEPLEGLAPPPKGHLRTGFTTGACATAAAKAATMGLLTEALPSQVTITLPRGERVTFTLHRVERRGQCVFCSVIKDAGDDPDVTHGAEICAQVCPVELPEVTLMGGEGVGVVTKPGLGLPVGGPAINPVPRKMILDEVTAVLKASGHRHGLQITLSIPGGAELAKKTLNPRLGIVDGLSILGTTGIVKPYSVSSYKASIVKGMDVAQALGRAEVVLATGRRSEAFAQQLLSLPDESFIEVADFIGFSLRHAARKKFTTIYLAALVGKLTKVAQGELQTHRNASEVDPAFLATLVKEAGGDPVLVQRVETATSARQTLEWVQQAGLARFPQLLAARAAATCAQAIGGRAPVVALLFDFEGHLLARGQA